MELNLKVGIKKIEDYIVNFKDTALTVGSGNLDVLSTPMMIAWMENTAMNSVLGFLPVGYDTVGTRIDVNHIAGTPVNMKVKVESELKIIEGRKLVFYIVAYDEVEKIGEGMHERVVIEYQKFFDKVNQKLKI